MSEMKRFHSVRLDKNLCKGCTNCLMHCPTEAIRVHDGRAHIIDERCIDCGECIRECSNHAKIVETDPLSAIKNYQYSIALPAPSLYAQFRNLKDIGYVLSALKKIGFDDVFEVARAADIVSRAIHEKLRDPNLPRPLISSACPTIVRLIQVRFPDLIPNICDIRQPMELAADIARTEFCKKNNCKPEDVGVFFITPCPAKMTAIRSPIGQKKSCVDGAISMMEIYRVLRPHVVKMENEEDLHGESTHYGVGWASSNGESKVILCLLTAFTTASACWRRLRTASSAIWYSLRAMPAWADASAVRWYTKTITWRKTTSESWLAPSKRRAMSIPLKRCRRR